MPRWGDETSKTKEGCMVHGQCEPSSQHFKVLAKLSNSPMLQVLEFLMKNSSITGQLCIQVWGPAGERAPTGGYRGLKAERSIKMLSVALAWRSWQKLINSSWNKRALVNRNMAGENKVGSWMIDEFIYQQQSHLKTGFCLLCIY